MHHLTSQLVFAFFVSALPVGTYALPGWPAGGTLVSGNAGLFDRSTWEANLASPNATGSSSVTGFDITQRWPSDEVDGWTLSVNVTSDIPDSETRDPGNSSGQTYTGTSIFLRAPENIQAAFANRSAIDETTWKICVVFIPNGPQEDQSTSDNGTCSFLSSQCVTDLQQAYADKFARNQDCYGTAPSTPSSCGDSVNTANFSTQQFPLDSSNGTEVFVTASDSHDPGDENAWENATGKVWPVLTIWGWNIRAGAPEGSSPRTQLSCIRANNIEPGSSSPSSSGSKVCGSEALAFTIACMAAYILL
ncbi:hypothetical protein F5X99DRAFT_389387 [Biscogniauxia marginata]|nr:hypothetical protein F5X99DRAFT_389387 [Biscogniauxia marginata]